MMELCVLAGAVLVMGLIFLLLKVVMGLLVLPFKLGFGLIKLLLGMLIGIPLLLLFILVGIPLLAAAIPLLVIGALGALLLAPVVLILKAIF